jgi:hypothetical protein
LATIPWVSIPFRIYGDLTPFIPLSLFKERGKIFERGASAPLRRPEKGGEVKK